ncbi:hypothetical protein [Xanthocytophaga flava]|uniref:hypothetical protein n=1 Tax=Xanthocytophaga flava TaxID=3048013 RepID=UPI0028D22723|nr:hypothetical protein [Xanthocytophaga flavus]MDJ1472442.1 hypothetical protein [Xanthocytophaga flavus]
MTEISFLFWNIKDQSEQSSSFIGAFAEMLKEVNAGIVCLAETNISDAWMQTSGYKLISETHRESRRSSNVKKWLKIYAKPGIRLLPLAEPYGNGELLATQLEVEKKRFIIMGAHLLSQKTSPTPASRFDRSIDLRNFIEGLEKHPNLSTQGTLVFGDFNMNPYEPAFTSTRGFFAIDLWQPFPRRMQNYPYFVNPTPARFGSQINNGTIEPGGTYYLRNKRFNTPDEFVWNMLDGLFFRPSMVKYYVAGSPLTIITKTQSHQLFTHDLIPPIDTEYSDHLPITFTFNFH